MGGLPKLTNICIKRTVPRGGVWLWVVVSVISSAVAARGAEIVEYDKPARFVEAPAWRAMVEAGTLPPVEQRVPDEPLVIGPGDAYGTQSIGRYGGVIRFDATDPPNVQGASDITVPFFFDRRDTYYPLVFKGYEASDDRRVWTFHMRRGMKWSDGHLFTADDVLFWYEAVVKNKELTPSPPAWLQEDGRFVRMEKMDDYTFRVVFQGPRLRFLQNIAECERQITACPKHYLKQFHPDYTTPAELAQRLADADIDGWTQLWEARQDPRLNSNLELPTLCPWRVKKGIPANPTRYERNPYYWIVDSEGRQLPYADDVWVTVVGNAERKKLRQVLGNISFSALPLEAVELAKLEADKGHIRIGWRPPMGDINSGVLSFNFLSPDPFRRTLLNDRRFRIAMSLQMPRQIINEIQTNGLTKPKQIGLTVPSHRWYNDKLANAYLQYDLDEANRLLDEIGLTERGPDGMRLNPDGDPIVFSMMTVTNPPWIIMCEIIAEYLPKVGLQANMRSVGWDGLNDVLREARWDIAVNFGGMGYPHQWPDRMDAVRPSMMNAYAWMRWLQTDGRVGEEPTELMTQCWRHWQQARTAANDAELDEHVQWLLNTAAVELWAVGVNNYPPSLMTVAPNVRNVPFDRTFFLKSAVYLVDPTSKE